MNKQAKEVLKNLEERLSTNERQREVFLSERKKIPETTPYDKVIESLKEQIKKIKIKYGK